MLFLSFMLTFVWLNPGVGPVTEKTVYPTRVQCEAAKTQKIAEKIYRDRPGDLVFSHALHAECREQ